MSVTIGLLITLGVQAGVALANQKWNSENAKAIRDIQRTYKKDAQNMMLRRDREKFEHARELQMQMEFESQQERIRSLNQDFLNSFKKMAHNATLVSHYPLKVSPYVISKTVLPISDAQLSNTRQEVLCILTTSNNSAFNKEVLPYLDETISQAVARYWNGNSLSNVCYYQGMWDNKKDYCEENIENVKAVINSPTLTLTPFFVLVLIALVYTLCPIFSLYKITFLKDVPFSILLVLWVPILYEIWETKGKNLENAKTCIKIGLLLCLSFIRGNGIYISVFILICIVAVAKKMWKRILAFLLVLILASGGVSIFENQLGVKHLFKECLYYLILGKYRKFKENLHIICELWQKRKWLQKL